MGNDIENQASESAVASPPPPEMTIRTMKSDLATLDASGGLGTTPVTFRLPDQSDNSAGEEKFSIPGYTGPEKPIFRIAETAGASHSMAGNEERSGRGEVLKIVFMIAGAVIAVGLFWIIGYYFVSPWLFPAEMPSVQQEN